MKLGSKHYANQLKKKVLESIENGSNPTEMARKLNISRSSIYRWIGRSRESDTELKRVVGTGKKASLSLDQINKILAYVQRPASNYGFENDLWSTPRLTSLIKDKLKVNIHRTTVHRMLTEHNQSSKKPEYRWAEADAEKQRLWLKDTVPAIKRFVTKTRAVLYFFDEASISLTPSKGRTWGPKGKTTIVRRTGKRGSISALSAISPDKKLLFSVKRGTVKGDNVVEFFKRIMASHKNRSIVIVLDNATAHHSKAVKDFVEQNANLKLYYLPAYSPEWNADEKVWNHLKSVELVAHQEKDLDGLLSLTRNKLRGMACRPKLLRGIFQRCEIASFFN